MTDLRQGVAPITHEVLDEIERAIAKFPTWPTDPLHALAVLGKEFGELTKAVLQSIYEPHKSPPRRTEAGTSIGLRFPMLIITNCVERPDAVAEHVADVLEEHWDAGDQPGAEDERAVIVRYMRDMATLRPADALALGVIASDIEAMFHHDPQLNPNCR